jgi:hypothetical protein
MGKLAEKKLKTAKKKSGPIFDLIDDLTSRTVVTTNEAGISKIGKKFDGEKICMEEKKNCMGKLLKHTGKHAIKKNSKRQLSDKFFFYQ